MIRIFKLLGIFSILAVGCANAIENNATENNTSEQSKRMASGFNAFKTMCASCHSLDSGVSNRIAPKVAAIKRHYMFEEPNLSDFKDALISFVNDPSAEKARMKGAIKRFGLMPKMSFDDDTTADIAYYIYHTPLDSPNWFKHQYPLEQQRYAGAITNKLDSLEDYKKHGQQLAMQTKSALGSELKRALKEGGPQNAVAFCNTRAIPITNEMSKKLGAQIKRVSDKPRNPNNSANHAELMVMSSLKDKLIEGKKPKPVLKESGNKVVGYYPIVTNAMCLNCHGAVNENINSKTLEVINKKYPNDQAIGYDINQLRGLFVVEMIKQSE